MRLNSQDVGPSVDGPSSPRLVPASSGPVGVSSAPGRREAATKEQAQRRGRGAAEPPLLVHREQSFTPPSMTAAERRAEREAESKRQQAREWRRLRYSRRQRSSSILIGHARRESGRAEWAPGVTAGSGDWVRPARPARCRWRCDETVTVHGDREGAHFSGLQRCASIWACPVCASVIRAERAREVQQAVDWWQSDAQGGSIVFVTLTLRHKKGDPLAVSLEAAMSSWRGLLQGKAWGSFKRRYGVRYYIRAVEITYGRNGWHPHVHALFFTNQPLTSKQAVEMKEDLYRRWVALVVKNGGREPTEVRGVDVRPGDKDGTVLAQYLGKMQDSHVSSGGKVTARRSIGAEIARFDFKAGRGRSVMPFELLDGDAGDEDEDEGTSTPARLWVEYVEATNGRRAITWSRGLKRLAELNHREDEEIIEEADRGEVRFAISGDEYDRRILNEPAVATTVLELVENDSVEAARALAGGQYVIETVDDETGEVRYDVPETDVREVRARETGRPEVVPERPDPARLRERFRRGRDERLAAEAAMGLPDTARSRDEARRSILDREEVAQHCLCPECDRLRGADAVLL